MVQPGSSTGPSRDWFIPLLIAAAPVFVGTLQLYLASYGNLAIFSALVSAVNLTTLWTILLVQFLPLYGALFLPLWYLYRPLRDPARFAQIDRSGVRIISQTRRILVASATLLALGALFVPWFLLILALVYYGILIFTFRRMDKNLEQGYKVGDRAAFREELRAVHNWDLMYRVAGLLIAAGFFVVAGFSGKLGVPTEWVKLKSQPEYIFGYVTGVDDVSLNMFFPSGVVARFPVGDVQDRVVCPSPSRPIYKYTGVQLLVDRLMGKPEQSEACATLTRKFAE